jgi:putative iron-dependent peroxidase
MLTNMFLGDPPGNTDRILDFSTAVTGALFFAPPMELLEGLADADEPGAAEAQPDTPEVDPGDGSLGIGSLRDQRAD